ncbi:MAG: tetratricopeptide repeat protein [Deltaproteobacteria bacterium]|nr:tetratricopeptide repeat protein [Deltaproteobacteria bacterium]
MAIKQARLMVWVLAVAAAIGIGDRALAQDAAKRAEAKAHKARGDAFVAKGQNADAIAAYRQALATDADLFEAYEDLGITLVDEKKYDEAIVEFKKAIEKRPTYHRGHYNIAYALRKQGKHKDAVESYRKFLAAVPKDPDGYYGLAESLKAMNDSRGALENYRKYVEIENRAEEKKWVDKAKAEIARLEADEKKTTGAAVGVGAAAVGAGAAVTTGAKAATGAAATTASTASATSAGTASTATAPIVSPAATTPAAETREQKMSRGMTQEGLTHIKNKNSELALFSFRDAIRLDDTNVDAHYNLGLVYALIGAPAKAMAHFRRVLELQPTHAEARAKLGK